MAGEAPRCATRCLTPCSRTSNARACLQCLRKLLLEHSGYKNAARCDIYRLTRFTPSIRLQCLRKLLLKHSGYESATEGDSFLLAFHCPEDALLFAMEAQVGACVLACWWGVG